MKINTNGSRREEGAGNAYFVHENGEKKFKIKLDFKN